MNRVMREKLAQLISILQRLPLPMQLIIVVSVLATILAALSIEVYKRYTVAQQAELQTLWPHVRGGAPPKPQKIRALSGLWIYESQQHRARLQMTHQGTFQLITRRKDFITRRNYVRGFYTVDNQTLYLRQDDRFGRPYVKGKPAIDFHPISLRTIAVDYKLQRRGQRMLWHFANSNEYVQNLQYNLAGQSVERVRWYKMR